MNFIIFIVCLYKFPISVSICDWIEVIEIHNQSPSRNAYT